MASYQFASYSLADYALVLKVEDTALQAALGLSTDTVRIGGEGQFMGKITVKFTTPQWSTKADATGAWVHSRSFDQSGEVNVSINQMSDAVIRFIRIVEAYYSSIDIRAGFTLTISKTSDVSFSVACEDCRVVKIPDQVHDKEAQEQEWAINSGRIIVNA